MGKLRIEHGASKVQWVPLKTTVEDSIASDLELMCTWSNNERKYIVNELLRFALAQSEDFQKYKSELHPDRLRVARDPKPEPSAVEPTPDRPVKAVTAVTSAGGRQ